MNVPYQDRSPRGVTLVELLVVVTILMMLAAFAIPVMRPLTEGRRIREAARAIGVFLTQAKIRAVEIQRPVGVEFRRMTEIDFGDPNDASDDTILFDQDDACNTLRIVEIPPPYGGNFTNSRVRVQDWTFMSGSYYHVHPITGRAQVVLKVIIQSGDFSDGLIRRGDTIQFNHQGPFYEIFDDPVDNPPPPANVDHDFPVDPATGYIQFARDWASGSVVGVDTAPLDGWIDNYVLSVRVDASELGGVPWPAHNGSLDAKTFYGGGRALWSGDVSFQIYRQPTPSPVDPLRLPKDTVIDLADSGYLGPGDAASFSGGGLWPDVFGITGAAASQRRSPMILFSPEGSVQAVYHWDTALSYAGYRVTKPVFLMVGKWERTGVASTGPPVRSNAEDGLHNWQDASNLWMAIGPRNGLVTTAEVNTLQATPSGISVPADPYNIADPSTYPYPVVGDPSSATDPAQLARQMYSSRAYAREAQVSKGALEE